MRDADIVNLVNTCWSDLPKAREILQNDGSLISEKTEIDETVLTLLLRWYVPKDYDIKQHIEAIKMLLDFGANINESNNCGSNPLHHAISSGEKEVVKLLLQKGANINPEYGFIGQPTLHLAILHKDIELIKLLIENGADIHALDNFGQTPLHLTVANDENIELTKLLVSHGADINRLSGFELTPLDDAYSEKSMLTIKYLMDIGSIFNKTDVDDMLEMEYNNELHYEILDFFSEQNKTK